jgi:hypothetical protein
MELNKYIANLVAVWDLSTNSLVSESNQIINQIIADSSLNHFVSERLQEKDNVELYRDEKYGFILSAYIEKFGQYRIPHNHGNGWVIYSVVRGEMEMGSYDQNLYLINFDRLRSGDSRVYLPGEIHDTRCLSQDVIILRFTSCDLKVEEKEGRMIRFSLSESVS